MQKLQTFYRVDKREFFAGDVITSAQEFLTKNPSGTDSVEAAFEAVRPGHKQKRDQCLYIFETLADAQRHWCKMTGGRLYAVAVEDEEVFHRADMALVDRAFREREDWNALQAYATAYWSSDLTEKPVIEILVKKATVLSVISKDERERLECFRKYAKGL